APLPAPPGPLPAPPSQSAPPATHSVRSAPRLPSAPAPAPPPAPQSRRAYPPRASAPARASAAHPSNPHRSCARLAFGPLSRFKPPLDACRLNPFAQLLPASMQMRPHRPNRQPQRQRNLLVRPLFLMIEHQRRPLHLAQPLQLPLDHPLKLVLLHRSEEHTSEL